MKITKDQMEQFNKKADTIDQRLAQLMRLAADARVAFAKRDKLALEEDMLRVHVCAEELSLFENDGTPHGKARSAAENAFFVVPHGLLLTDADEADKELSGGIEYPTKIDKQVYEAIRKRADDRCERCGRIGAHVAHHLHYRTKGCEGPEDLLLVCDKCHDALHNALFTPERRKSDPEKAKRIRENDNPVPFVVLEE